MSSFVEIETLPELDLMIGLILINKDKDNFDLIASIVLVALLIL